MPECPDYDGVPTYGGPCWTCQGDPEHCPLASLTTASVWEHWKGGYYLVLKVGTGDDGKAVVIYRKWPSDARPAAVPWANIAATSASVEWYTRPLAQWHERESGEWRFRRVEGEPART